MIFRWIESVAVAAVVLVLTGCGGEGGGGGGGSQSAQSQNFAPGSVSGQTLMLNGTVARELRFEPSGALWAEERNGAPHGGTYLYAVSGNSAELILSESGVTSIIRLTFSSSDSGAYIAGQDQGTFRIETTETTPNDPGPSPGDPGEEGLAPANLDGRTLYGTRTFTSTGPNGQTHVYTFSAGNFHDSDPPEESDGNYVYQPAGARAVLTLFYTSPKEFNGDQHRLDMTFLTGTSGTFESVYARRDGTTIQINGTFQIE